MIGSGPFHRVRRRGTIGNVWPKLGGMSRGQREAGERQLALLESISAHPGITRAQLLEKIPAYRSRPAGESRQRMFERDVETLRNSGYAVIVEDDRYELSRTTPVVADVGVLGAGIIRALISALPGHDVRAGAARTGLTKMLSEAQETTPTAPARAGQAPGAGTAAGWFTQASIPSGDEVLSLARALQTERRVSFEYERAPGQYRSYEFEPWSIEEHYDAFYVSGVARYADREAADKPGPQSRKFQSRTFRVDRIVTGSVRVIGPAVHRRAQVDSALSTGTKVELAIRRGCAAPLAARGTYLRQFSAAAPDTAPQTASGHGFEMGAGTAEAQIWEVYEYAALPRNSLFEDLIFYGPDVQILHPQEVRQEWEARLAHVAQVCAASAKGSAAGRNGFAGEEAESE
ncbi:Uncharacterised protein [Actinobaculum suis]|uniref:WYL domain-containing protein n=2 Tax=Actinobaculum suis TaxID=1657 RepID=A0A7Z8Y8V8_9ACTO|nr:Uncharacterised protein [Actinobaculum suis]